MILHWLSECDGEFIFIFLIDQSACYKFNVAKTHYGTDSNCRPTRDRIR